jgi:hypothetical protein
MRLAFEPEGDLNNLTLPGSPSENDATIDSGSPGTERNLRAKGCRFFLVPQLGKLDYRFIRRHVATTVA